MTGLSVVVTTIQPPTPAVESLARAIGNVSARLLVVGDTKGPISYNVPNTELITLEMQRSGPFNLGRSAPTGHYARKNLGYLAAMAAGATCIYETDDDNAPLPGWTPRTRETQATSVGGQTWVNVYAYFSTVPIWPRGLPLDEIRRSAPSLPKAGRTPTLTTLTSSIQQGLANRSPDVDAIWRFVNDRPVAFEPGPSVSLRAGCFCPFNSQSTWWWPPAFPLMYLPSYCSFRMTDIWRSFVAQRCLWEIGEQIVFHPPEVVQERNEHRLLEDFQDEIPGYLRNRLIVEQLFSSSLRAGPKCVSENLRTCYETLVAAGHLPAKEMALVDDWLTAVRASTL